MDTSKGTEYVNEESGMKEVRVETVDYRTPPGDDKLPEKKDVRIVHQTVEGKSDPGVVQKGMAAVGRVADSAKEAVVGNRSDKPE